MAIFNSYVTNYQRVNDLALLLLNDPWTPWTPAFSRLCFSARLFDALRKISDELNAESVELSDGDSWTS
jgi:hypothetical protein